MLAGVVVERDAPLDALVAIERRDRAVDKVEIDVRTICKQFGRRYLALRVRFERTRDGHRFGQETTQPVGI